ncbi:alpha/beta fold hydrolase [Cohnella sp. CFH 77786]|uniref:alpha/beta fold hydrolase n=1 Tax=Cohnella sp. CFH 77786 TaxID=2662265 RepID=UPI001C60F940|nr:alpha/beta hydrolase [Cohnella sp. CFH 77786]MBW5448906.1 alpha/beta fold hydrolase [Cohnella sp. CFH 77786]
MKPIPKEKIVTPHGSLEYARLGEGEPAIIMINGGNGPIEGWYKVIHEIAEHSTVVAYNRLGVGGSDKPSSPQHGKSIVTALRHLLKEINLQPPYILVGHSLGGLYANLFARQYPQEIKGVVLLDSSHPQDMILNQTQNAFIREINRVLGVFDPLFPHRQWNETRFVEQTVQQIETAGPFPDVPLFVVSGGKKPPMMPGSMMELRRQNQLDFLRLSLQSRHVLASQSGHFPQFTEPAVVTQAILDCVGMARQSSAT